MIINKKNIVFILAALFHITLLAQSEVLTLYRKDGTTVQYSFIDNPKILQQGENLIMKTKNIEVSYPFNDISKYTLNESKEEIDLYDIIIDNDNLEEYINETDIEGCDITYIRTFNDTHWQSFYVPFEVEPRELADDFEFALINNFHQYDDNDDGLFDRVELEIKQCRKECEKWGMNSEVFVYNWDGTWELSDIFFLKNGYKYAINSRGVGTRNSTNPYRLGRTSFQEALPFETVKKVLKW